MRDPSYPPCPLHLIIYFQAESLAAMPLMNIRQLRRSTGTSARNSSGHCEQMKDK
jgi:hypothetical protein